MSAHTQSRPREWIFVKIGNEEIKLSQESGKENGKTSGMQEKTELAITASFVALMALSLSRGGTSSRTFEN